MPCFVTSKPLGYKEHKTHVSLANIGNPPFERCHSTPFCLVVQVLAMPCRPLSSFWSSLFWRSFSNVKVDKGFQIFAHTTQTLSPMRGPHWLQSYCFVLLIFHQNMGIYNQDCQVIYEKLSNLHVVPLWLVWHMCSKQGTNLQKLNA